MYFLHKLKHIDVAIHEVANVIKRGDNIIENYRNIVSLVTISTIILALLNILVQIIQFTINKLYAMIPAFPRICMILIAILELTSSLAYVFHSFKHHGYIRIMHLLFSFFAGFTFYSFKIFNYSFTWFALLSICIELICLFISEIDIILSKWFYYLFSTVQYNYLYKLNRNPPYNVVWKRHSIFCSECGHKYHWNCLREWERENNYCNYLNNRNRKLYVRKHRCQCCQYCYGWRHKWDYNHNELLQEMRRQTLFKHLPNDIENVVMNYF
eukprot:146533_1